jgi:F0F1-type ATP synthase assembly protein I
MVKNKDTNDRMDWIIGGILVIVGILFLFGYYVILQGTNNFMILAVIGIMACVESVIRKIRHKK